MPSGRLAGSSALLARAGRAMARPVPRRCRAPRNPVGEGQLVLRRLQQMGRERRAPWRARHRSPSRQPCRPYAWSARRHARAAFDGARIGLHVADRLRSARPAGRPRSGHRRSRGPGRWIRCRPRPSPCHRFRSAPPRPRWARRARFRGSSRRPGRAACRALRLGPPRLEACRVGARHGGVEVGHEAARIDRHAHRRLVRERGDQVLPPELSRIAAEPARRGFDAALDDVVGLGLARAAIGIDRHRVGEGAAHVDRDRRGCRRRRPARSRLRLAEAPGPLPER